MTDTFDLIAIGGGTGGLVTAAGASYLRAANQSRRAALQGLGGRLLRRVVRWGL